MKKSIYILPNLFTTGNLLCGFLSVIASTEDPVGLKVSGGVRTTEDAAAYLALADQMLGPNWVSPGTFRFGASGLLVDLLSKVSDPK